MFGMSAGDLLAQWVFGLWQTGRISSAEAVQAGEAVEQLRALERGTSAVFAMGQAATARRSVVTPKLTLTEPPAECRSSFMRHDWWSREGRPLGQPSKAEQEAQRERALWTGPLDQVLADRRRARQAA